MNDDVIEKYREELKEFIATNRKQLGISLRALSVKIYCDESTIRRFLKDGKAGSRLLNLLSTYFLDRQVPVSGMEVEIEGNFFWLTEQAEFRELTLLDIDSAARKQGITPKKFLMGYTSKHNEASALMSKNIKKPNRIFFSYAREDKKKVERVYDSFIGAGFDVWLDSKSLKWGETYKREINDIIKQSDFAVVFFSQYSINKKGFVSYEFRSILESAKYRQLDIPYAMPVRLDDCKIPVEFSSLNWIDLFEDYEKSVRKMIQDLTEYYELT